MFNNNEQKVLLVLAIVLIAGSFMRSINIKMTIPAWAHHSANHVYSEKHQIILNLNTASINELDKLDGIGLSLASRIVDYRTTKGDFKTIDDLLKVKGMTRARLRKIYFQVTL